MKKTGQDLHMFLVTQVAQNITIMLHFMALAPSHIMFFKEHTVIRPQPIGSWALAQMLQNPNKKNKNS